MIKILAIGMCMLTALILFLSIKLWQIYLEMKEKREKLENFQKILTGGQNEKERI